jgi:hypothetical protein
VVAVLERAIAAIERAHSVEMRELREMQQLEARGRRRGIITYNLDADPDADF